MTAESVKQIKKAEENGAQLLVNAQTEANFQMERAKEELKQSQLLEEARLEKELNERLAVKKAEADKIVEDEKIEAVKDADALERETKKKMADAVSYILEVIKKQWQ